MNYYIAIAIALLILGGFSIGALQDFVSTWVNKRQAKRGGAHDKDWFDRMNDL